MSIMRAVREDFQGEDWVSLYSSALVELEQAKMAGRFSAARKSILARIEKLRTIPGLHSEEYSAIDDALGTLGILEREEARFDAEGERRAIEQALEKLHSLKGSIERLKSNS